MAKIVIIGNGFDLSHGMHTSYAHFIEKIVNDCIEGNSDLINLADIETFKSLKEQVRRGSIDINKRTANRFLAYLLTKDIHNPNWCDIEASYFEYLNARLKDEESIRYSKIKDFHAQFGVIIGLLEEYLEGQQNRISKKSDSELKLMDAYVDFFGKIESDEHIIVNFNYTDIVEKYLESSISLINIHGKIKNEDFPIIFGYAADEEACKKLFLENNNESFRHIKKFNYALSSAYQTLMYRMNSFKKRRLKLEIVILGHSCSVSDKLILNEIIRHSPDNSKIRIFYNDKVKGSQYKVKGSEHFFQTQINLARVLDGNLNPLNLISFSNSCRMPQFKDDSELIRGFTSYANDKMDQ